MCAVQELSAPSAPLLAMSNRGRNRECSAVQGEGGSPGSMLPVMRGGGRLL